MKVVISSLMLLALLQLATCDCESSASEAQECLRNLAVSPLLKDLDSEAVRTEADKEKIVCCGLKYIRTCVDYYLGRECPELAAAASASARDAFLQATRSATTCIGVLPTNCEGLSSLFSL
ncbi:uncharacterized protein LOC135398800 [Ornithodoros turicata]|uniref:uncharacterized protein LOC135398800 n=1 Tax=Ornithodoros turicata TaxID=34597 RepID=UPI003139AD69